MIPTQPGYEGNLLRVWERRHGVQMSQGKADSAQGVLYVALNIDFCVITKTCSWKLVRL